MELQLLQTLLMHDNFGWIGWFMLISVLVLFGIGLFTNYLIVIAKNVKTLKEAIRQPDYKAHIKAEADIQHALKTLREDTRSDKIMILQYHNGVHSIANNSLLKISLTHESTNKFIKPSIQDYQNVPSTFYGDWNLSIFDNKCIKIPNIETETETEHNISVISQLKAENVKAAYFFPISDVYGNVFGIGIVQYLQDNYNMDDNQLLNAKSRFTGIGALLAGPKKD